MNLWETLIKLSKLHNVDIFYGKEDSIQIVCEVIGDNPLRTSQEMRKSLMDKVTGTIPGIYQDAKQILFTCVPYNGQYLFIGPMASKGLSRIDLYEFYAAYGIRTENKKAFPVIAFSKALMLISFISVLVNGDNFTEEELIRTNHLAEHLDEMVLEQNQVVFALKAEEEEHYHHTYKQERMLLDAVREGRVEEALSMNMGIDVEIGRLSANEMTHWHNVVVVAITLCTRAAIEGGLSPAEAYQISDFYIQKGSECRDVAALITCRNRAVREFTERVAKKKSAHPVTGYIENTKNYISAHYREKIYLEEVAEQMGISPSYLSKLFVKETGERFSDYIVKFRVERAANLLMYSEETISYIAEYVNFPSQSYLGKVFKKYKGMTPQKYRDKYKPREFIGKMKTK